MKCLIASVVVVSKPIAMIIGGTYTVQLMGKKSNILFIHTKESEANIP